MKPYPFTPVIAAALFAAAQVSVLRADESSSGSEGQLRVSTPLGRIYNPQHQNTLWDNVRYTLFGADKSTQLRTAAHRKLLTLEPGVYHVKAHEPGADFVMVVIEPGKVKEVVLEDTYKD